MNWIVKILNEKNQRIRITFNPMKEVIYFYGECRLKNNEWTIFSEKSHVIVIELLEIQKIMEIIVIVMRKRLIEYNNINEGFSVLKEVEFKEN